MFRFCWHKWSDWGKPHNTSTSFSIYQHRTCSKCGAKSSRKMTFNNSVHANSMEDIKDETKLQAG